jgi:hypothetical protein
LHPVLRTRSLKFRRFTDFVGQRRLVRYRQSSGVVLRTSDCIRQGLCSATEVSVLCMISARYSQLGQRTAPDLYYSLGSNMGLPLYNFILHYSSGTTAAVLNTLSLNQPPSLLYLPLKGERERLFCNVANRKGNIRQGASGDPHIKRDIQPTMAENGTGDLHCNYLPQTWVSGTAPASLNTIFYT